MTREQLHTRLLELNYTYERDSEYNQDCYSNRANIVTNVGKFDAKIEIFVTYYSVKIVWYYRERSKVSESYLFSTLGLTDTLEELLGMFFLDCERKFYVDIEKFRADGADDDKDYWQ